MTEITLREGKISDCPIYKRHIHKSILEANNVRETVCNRKILKRLIQILIPEVESNSTSSVR